MSSSGSGPSLQSVDPSIAGMIGMLEHIWIVKYTNVAFLMLMVYDHFITFDLEVSRIWSLPWRAPKFLFTINRYIVPPMLVFNGLLPSIYFLPQKICDFVARWTLCPTVIAMATIEITLILRVTALYSHSKTIIRFLWTLFSLEMAAFLVISCILIAHTTGSPGGDLFSGCLFSAPHYFYAAWIPPAIFESIILSLTMYKVFQYNSVSPTLHVLARDSLVYFLVMFSILLANLLLARFSTGFMSALLLGPSSVVACISAARMTMNIREFTMAASELSTAGEELKTIRFRRGQSDTSIGQDESRAGWSLSAAELSRAWASKHNGREPEVPAQMPDEQG